MTKYPMRRVKRTKIYECGHEEIVSEFLAPDNIKDIIEPRPTPCMSCLTEQWRKDKEQGFSLRDMFHQLHEEEQRESKVEDELEENED